MSSTWVIVIVVALVGPVLVSYLIEALRPEPPTPTELGWAPEIPIRYIEVNGIKIRYITAGEGPPLVLLHTLRTQLDIFQKVVPGLARRFTVFAPDYPGHGYSDILEADYGPELFVEAIEGFLEKLDLKDVTLAGISIGGTIPLLIAARHNPRVNKVIAINPYDYAGGGGIARSSPTAKVIFTLARIPIIGGTVMRFRNRMVEGKIMVGGVSDPSAIPPQFAEEMFRVGTRPGHYKAFLNLINNAEGWEKARAEYKDIQIPVFLIYGDRDWSTPEERETDRASIRGARMEVVAGGGHFLSLDRPGELEQLITKFAG